MNSHIKNLYTKRKHKLIQLHSKEKKQFILEQHVVKHPTDYTSVISNELLKSDIKRIEYSIKEIDKQMELYTHD